MGSGRHRLSDPTPVVGRGSDTVNKDDYNEFKTSFQGADGLCHQPAANTDAVINFLAADGVRHVIRGVAWSYDVAPAAATTLTIVTGADTIFQIHITAAGPGFIPFSPGLAGIRGQHMRVTLATGGAGVTGRLNILGYWQE
jgi:hypothetical protein